MAGYLGVVTPVADTVDLLKDYYTKTETETKIVDLSPPTDLTAVNANIADNELAIVTNASALVVAQNQIIINHP